LTFVITSPCIGTKDRSCVEVCPVDCIYDTERMLVIHPEECIDCGACEPVCPVEAIYPAEDVPEEWQAFHGINAAIIAGKDAAERALDESSEAGVGPDPA
jgi:NAD-dependent dihydropyrimidine dehydrogenase PreA subunit